MSDVLVGEVVDPGKIVICEPGKAAAARAQMDRRGEYGGVVRESAECPKGQIIAIDMDRIKAAIDKEVTLPYSPWELSREARLGFIYGASLTPPKFPTITGI